MADENRTKPRVSIVLSPEERELGELLRAERGLPFSTFLGQLIREEAARRGVKPAKRRAK